VFINLARDRPLLISERESNTTRFL